MLSARGCMGVAPAAVLGREIRNVYAISEKKRVKAIECHIDGGGSAWYQSNRSAVSTFSS